jgi:outer membrane murein-binding lipoprotein Lpp
MNKRIIGAILILTLLAGCATPQVTTIRRGDPVEIVFTKSPHTDGAIDIRNEEMSNTTAVGAGTGGVSGAVAGGLWGLACGPLAIFCVPALALTFAITGTAVGAAVGAGVGVTGSLSSKKSDPLTNRLMRVQQSHSLLAELQKNVNDRAEKHWKLGTEQSAVLMTIELQDLLLRSTRDEQISCVVQVKVSVQQRGAKQTDTPEPKMYEYVSTFVSLSVWMDESSDYIDTLFTSASQQIAAHIVSDLSMEGVGK